jgi:hypothetical protein
VVVVVVVFGRVVVVTRVVVVGGVVVVVVVMGRVVVVGCPLPPPPPPFFLRVVVVVDEAVEVVEAGRVVMETLVEVVLMAPTPLWPFEPADTMRTTTTAMTMMPSKGKAMALRSFDCFPPQLWRRASSSSSGALAACVLRARDPLGAFCGG